MATGKNKPIHRIIDPQLVAAITREVVARLTATNLRIDSDAPKPCILDRVVTTDTLSRIKGTPAELWIAQNAVLTPAARDEAIRRGIKIQRETSDLTEPITPPPINHSSPSPAADPNNRILDHAKPERAEAVAAQIANRGITRVGATILLSETPATDVHHQCTVKQQRAVMVNSLCDVDRFAAELRPTVWVLDMVRINLITAVNIVARIAKQPG